MTTRIIRRRSGTNDVSIARHADGAVSRTVRLETDGVDLPMRERITQAINGYIKTTLEDAPPFIATQDIEEREDQEQILRNAVPYFTTILDELNRDPYAATPRSRLVAPARTGKTIVMIKLISRLGLKAVIVTPTGTILEKTVEELRRKLPSVSVGAYYGPSKEIVAHGVTVATYQTLALHAKRGILPPSITRAALVLCDEGHETMTENRQDALSVFSDQAIMIALTATPDYNRHRVLATYFPYLIDDVRLIDACARGLLAPTRVRVRAVEVDESMAMICHGDREVSVATVKGDFDGVAMSRVLKNTTVFKACLAARYEETSDHPTLQLDDGTPMPIIHKQEKALICCPSVDFAHDLAEFLSAQRPAGTPAPCVVVGETPPEKRREIIMALRNGEIDTVINVGVLLRGFDDPSLKLLIDLSPTVSLVRAEQKFCRPCTKVGDRGAVIYLIYPYGLSPTPLLPTDIFGASYVGSADQVLTPKPSREPRKPTQKNDREQMLKLTRAVRVTGVTTLREFSIELKPPTFDPDNHEQVRAVFGTSQDFAQFLWYASRVKSVMEYSGRVERVFIRQARHRMPTVTEFKSFLFTHPTFTGFGGTLLRFCKVPAGSTQFRNWLRTMLPEIEIILGTYEEVLVQTGAIDSEGEYVEELVPNFDEFASDWLDPYERALRREVYSYTSSDSDCLTNRQQYVLDRWLHGDTFPQISEGMNLSRARVAQIQHDAVLRLRSLLVRQKYDWYDFR